MKKMKSEYTQDSFISRPKRSLNSHLCRIRNSVVGTATNPLLALKTNLTDICASGRLSRLAINESRSFRSLAINESWLLFFCDYERLNPLTNSDRYPVAHLLDFCTDLYEKKTFSPVASVDFLKATVITLFDLWIYTQDVWIAQRSPYF